MSYNAEARFSLLEHDVPEVLADTFFDNFRTHRTDYTADEWESLTEAYPNLRDFISSLGAEIAPTDPELRQKLVGSMLGLLALVGAAKDSEHLEALWAKDMSLVQVKPEEAA